MAARTRNRKEQVAQKAAPKALESNQSPNKELPVRTKDDESPKVRRVAKGSITVFDEGSNAAPITIAEATVAKPEESEEADGSSSDDEAPEAVSTTKAASVVKKSAQAAQKAAQEQNALQKRRRQERDALYKKQAEQRKQTEQTTTAEEDDEVSEPVGVERLGLQDGTDRIRMPNLLPMEYLTDNSSEDEDGDVGMGAKPSLKRRKVANVERDLSLLDRGPRDARDGDTAYRILRQIDQKLTPKARKQSKNSRELLMRRNRTPVQARRSFFTKV